MVAQSPTPIATAMRVSTTMTMAAHEIPLSPQPSGGFKPRHRFPIMYSMRHDTITSESINSRRCRQPPWSMVGGRAEGIESIRNLGSKVGIEPTAGVRSQPPAGQTTDRRRFKLLFWREAQNLGSKLRTWVQNSCLEAPPDRQTRAGPLPSTRNF